MAVMLLLIAVPSMLLRLMWHRKMVKRKITASVFLIVGMIMKVLVLV